MPNETELDRPNIILILADDMGFSDIGCYGGEIRTPHLDSMAKGGVRFTQMYNCARCCPSRASLLTGLHPHQAGVGHMIADRGVGPAYQGYLRSDCVTIGEVLNEHGYHTCAEVSGPLLPNIALNQGFDEYNYRERWHTIFSGYMNRFMFLYPFFLFFCKNSI